MYFTYNVLEAIKIIFQILNVNMSIFAAGPDKLDILSHISIL